MNKHRQCFIEMTEATENVDHECPNPRTRITHLLNSIECQDPHILAGVAAVHQDEQGKRVDFEKTVSFLAPYCPVAKKQKEHKQSDKSAQIASAKGGHIKPDLRSRKGKTGVELRYHKPHEFRRLTDDQRAELKKHGEKLKKEGSFLASATGRAMTADQTR